METLESGMERERGKSGRLAGKEQAVEERAVRASGAPPVSVVVATVGREQALLDTLEDLLRQDYPRFDVTVIDQNPEPLDPVRRLAENAEGRLQHYHLHPPHLCVARNAGIQQTTGELILFVDDDIRCGPDLIAAHASAYGDERIGGVGGWIDAPEASRVWHPAEDAVPSAIGCNMSFRRKVLEQTGGFHPALKPPLANGEETEICHRVRQAGYRVAVAPQARLWHRLAPSGGVRLRIPEEHWRAFIANHVFLFFRTRSWFHKSLFWAWTLKLWRTVQRLSGGAVSLPMFCASVREGRRMARRNDADKNHLAAAVALQRVAPAGAAAAPSKPITPQA